MTTDTLTLTEFLLAQIAEREATAREAHEAWDYSVTPPMHQSSVPRHIARNNPARVLADCEAKRLIVTQYLDAKRVRDEVSSGGVIEQSPIYMAMHAIVMALYPLIAKFAAAYAGHPDYREEWKP